MENEVATLDLSGVTMKVGHTDEGDIVLDDGGPGEVHMSHVEARLLIAAIEAALVKSKEAP